MIQAGTAILLSSEKKRMQIELPGEQSTVFFINSK